MIGLITLLWVVGHPPRLHGETIVPAAAPGTFQAYAVRGVLQRYDASRREATISHGPIPGYMPAMTMAFAVRDASALARLRPGDPLTFRLCVTPDTAWIEAVQKTAEAPSSPFAPAPAAPGRELRVGDLLPDAVCTDSSGNSFHLHELRDNVLALTFIYTRCPLPTYCPLLNRNFELAQNLLAQLEPNAPWRLLSISLDPTHDTPAVLRETAAAYHADSARWYFATAPVPTVRLLGNLVGLEFTDTGGLINHNLRTIVVDGRGRLRRVFSGNSWTPQELAAEMRSALASISAGN